MATVSRQSPALINRDSTPRILNNPFQEGGVVRQAMGNCSVATADSATSTYAFCQVPSNAVITSLKLYFNGTGGTTSSTHIGAWSPSTQGSGVIDNDCFASAVTLSTLLSGTDVVHEADVSATSAVGFEKYVWQVAGMSSDPGHPIEIRAQLSGAIDNTNTAGNMHLKAVVQYVVGSA